MHEVYFIGNIENTFNKEVLATLKTEYTVQLFNGRAIVFDKLLGISEPDFIFISLVAQNKAVDEMIRHISVNYRHIAVITLGSKSEAQKYSDLYESPQFVNIFRPVSAEAIYEECKQTMTRAQLLKARRKAETEAAAGTAESEAEDETSNSKKKKILVVDDNQLMLRNLKELLSKQYDVFMAASGSQALKLLAKKRIDMILLDYEMPEMNGAQVYRILQQTPEYANIPVVFLTGISSNEKVVEVLKLKPAGYILKPPEAETLFEKIEEIIGFY